METDKPLVVSCYFQIYKVRCFYFDLALAPFSFVRRLFLAMEKVQ